MQLLAAMHESRNNDRGISEHCMGQFLLHTSSPPLLQDSILHAGSVPILHAGSVPITYSPFFQDFKPFKPPDSLLPFFEDS